MADVVEIIDAQQAFANNAIDQTVEFLDRLSSLASADSFVISDLPETNYVNNSLSADAMSQLLSFRPTPPSYPQIFGVLPTIVEQLFSSLPDVAVPDFDKAAPTLTIPDAPSGALPTAPVAPAISDPVIPSAPDITFPVAPLLAGITFPDVPSVSIPTFNTTLPDDSDLLVPSNNFTFFEVQYQSALLSGLQAKLLADLTNGSYGIDPNDEALLWSRAREREVELASADMDEAFVQTAARGFPLPPGDLNVVLQRARQQLADKVSSISRDIAIKRGDLYVQARQFTIEQVKGVEQILIGFHNSIMERSLNAAKATLDASIEIFKAQVTRYNARLEAYKSEAQVFEARIRAQLALVEIYRTTMEGKRIESEVQRNIVSLYTAQLEAVNTVVSVYKTRLEAASIQAGIERIRLDSFRALIDAYTSQVSAKVAEFNMYDARIRGETSKMQAYQVEVQAYATKVSGAKTKADILVARLQSEIAAAQQKVDVFKARIEGYRADLQGQTSNVTAILSAYGGDVELFKASAGTVSESLRLTQNSRALDYQTNLATSQIAIQNAQVLFGGLKAAQELKLSAATAGSNVSLAIAAGAVNSINALVSLAAEAAAA